MKKIFIIILAGILMISGYFIYHFYRYAPKTNPAPKYFLMVSGHVGQHLPIKSIGVIYQTFNDSCAKTINYFEGATSPRYKFVDFEITSSDYTVKIPLDKVLPGKCDWHAHGLYYKSQNTKPAILLGLYFNNLRSLGNISSFNGLMGFDQSDFNKHFLPRGLINLTCDKEGLCQIKNSGGFGLRTMIPSNKNQKLILNFN